MRNLVADSIRQLARRTAQANRRLALVDITGKVKAGSQDMEKRTVRLILGKTADGQEILSAPVRWEASGAGALKQHATPKDGEQMTLHSPSGTVGPTSLARWGTYDKDNPPPSKKKDEAVLEFGKGRITIGEKSLKITFGDKSGFEISEDELQMLGRFKAKGGSRPAHYKGGKDDRGDTAVDGNDDVLI